MATVDSERIEAYRRVLELPAGATLDAVRRCHRWQMLRFHPDRGGSEERARLINEARDFFLAHPDQLEARQPEMPQRTAPISEPKATTVAVDVFRWSDGISTIGHGIWLLLKFSVLAYLVLLLIAIIGWLVSVGIEVLS